MPQVTIHFSAVACLLAQGGDFGEPPTRVYEVKTKRDQTFVLRARELVDSFFTYPWKFVRYTKEPHFASNGRFECSFLANINKKTLNDDMFFAIHTLEDGAADTYLEGDAFVPGTEKELVFDDARYVIDELHLQFASSVKTYWRKDAQRKK